ncbi:MAG: hypothetical protein IPJ74_08595 [Saprospiraceae bacterium]|nr:hypothetical protein [Saprospiraceae bacterium]
MRLYSFLLLLILTVSIANAQQRPYRIFKTQEVDKRLRKEYPAIIEERNKIERHIINYQERTFNKRDLEKKGFIGVVFHVLYQPGTEYPNLEQVNAQLDALNRDYGDNTIQINHPADTLEGFAEKAAIIHLSFCLPDKLPANRTAIQFVATDVKEWNTDDAIKSSSRGGSNPIEPKKYLNVWVGNLADKVSGYAQIPGGPEATDGIVIDYDYFGINRAINTPYNSGRTLTHLVGSYLGLHELWNENIRCGDDYVNDTPIHNAPNYFNYPYRHISSCPGYPTEMTMNFMDNTDDAWMYMFTKGQKARVLAMLTAPGPRHGILMQESKCAPESINDNLNLAGLDLDQNTSTEDSKPIRINAYPNPAQTQVTLEAELNQQGLAGLRFTIQ